MRRELEDDGFAIGRRRTARPMREPARFLPLRSRSGEPWHRLSQTRIAHEQASVLEAAHVADRRRNRHDRSACRSRAGG
ncbi:hypothetical protein [Sphingomonas hankookensis]|uniref:hypothetical protein n=1 Tax=Sphingomonas hankookensis TaxID=563996 RepID=UPI003D303258